MPRLGPDVVSEPRTKAAPADPEADPPEADPPEAGPEADVVAAGLGVGLRVGLGAGAVEVATGEVAL
jgi:hypothetical protein